MEQIGFAFIIPIVVAVSGAIFIYVFGFKRTELPNVSSGKLKKSLTETSNTKNRLKSTKVSTGTVGATAAGGVSTGGKKEKLAATNEKIRQQSSVNAKATTATTINKKSSTTTDGSVKSPTTATTGKKSTSAVVASGTVKSPKKSTSATVGKQQQTQTQQQQQQKSKPIDSNNNDGEWQTVTSAKDKKKRLDDLLIEQPIKKQRSPNQQQDNRKSNNNQKQLKDQVNKSKKAAADAATKIVASGGKINKTKNADNIIASDGGEKYVIEDLKEAMEDSNNPIVYHAGGRIKLSTAGSELKNFNPVIVALEDLVLNTKIGSIGEDDVSGVDSYSKLTVPSGGGEWQDTIIYSGDRF